MDFHFFIVLFECPYCLTSTAAVMKGIVFVIVNHAAVKKSTLLAAFAYCHFICTPKGFSIDGDIMLAGNDDHRW